MCLWVIYKTLMRPLKNGPCDATIHHVVTKHCFLSKLNWPHCVLLKKLNEMYDYTYLVIFIVKIVFYIKKYTWKD